MPFYWVELYDTPGQEKLKRGTVSAIDVLEACTIAAQRFGADTIIKRCSELPYPAVPKWNDFDTPEFCYDPEGCKGQTSCPKRPSCVE